MIPLERKIAIKYIKDQLKESDSDIVRALEDLIVLLIKTKVINIDVFPAEVYDIIKNRIKMRKKLQMLIIEEKETKEVINNINNIKGEL